MLSSAMPSEIRESILPAVEVAFGDKLLRNINSSLSGEDYTFDVVYMNQYNRHATRVRIQRTVFQTY